MRLRTAKAQSIVEFTILLGIVALVFSGMQIYVRRGLQGRVKQASDYMVASVKSDMTAAERARYDKPEWNSTLNPVYNGTIFEPVYWPTVINGRATHAESYGRTSMRTGGGTRTDYSRTLANGTQDWGDVIVQHQEKTVVYVY